LGREQGGRRVARSVGFARDDRDGAGDSMNLGFAARRARREAVARQGEILARLHWQCWREDAPPVSVSTEEFLSVLPVVIRSGSVGLVWPRLRGQFDPEGAIALAMEAAFAAQVEHNARVEREIGTVVRHLREAGIEPVLVKGFSVARQYPPGLVRPAGDIDLVVRAEDFERAGSVQREAFPDTDVDLQEEFFWPDRPNDAFWERTVTVDVGGVPVPVLAREDHLRVLCFHFLRHGGQRPLWLVDLAVAVERRGDGFDWNAALGFDPARRSWVTAALGCSARLVGLELDWAPPVVRGAALPGWVAQEVIRQWDEPERFMFEGASTLLVRRPGSVFRVLRERWPGPIAATFYSGRPVNGTPPVVSQWLAYGQRIGDHVRRRMASQLATARKIRAS